MLGLGEIEVLIEVCTQLMKLLDADTGGLNTGALVQPKR